MCHTLLEIMDNTIRYHDTIGDGVCMGDASFGVSQKPSNGTYAMAKLLGIWKKCCFMCDTLLQ
jgi:hypothetical protein